MMAGFIYYTGLIVSTGEISVNSFFSFLTAMMLAYQPIRSLATINMMFYQGAAAAERIFGVIDVKPNIKENETIVDETGKEDGYVEENENLEERFNPGIDVEQDEELEKIFNEQEERRKSKEAKIAKESKTIPTI